MQSENLVAATKNLQRYLRALSYFTSEISKAPIDGVFDEVTERALSDFQRTEGLPVTGRADRETHERLYARYLENATARNAPVRIAHFPRIPDGYTVAEGETQFLVRVIQHALGELSLLYNFPAPPEDGVYGADTAAAVRVFQEKHLLPVTGAVDLATWNALADAYNQAFGGYFAQ